jgi:hypothetical protein
MKIRDRFLLGLISGTAGNVIKTAVDELLLRLRLSQRSFHATAAGVWVDKKTEADSFLGHLLGSVLDFGVASFGGVATVYLLSNTGRDHLAAKGLTTGIIYGSCITIALSALPQNKVSPKNANSILAYMLSHAVYGIAATVVAANLGHPSLFDAPPHKDYLAPSEKTTKLSVQQQKQQEESPASGIVNQQPGK